MIPLAFTSLFVLLTFILSTTIIVSFLFYGVKMLIGLCLGVITLNELLHFCSIGLLICFSFILLRVLI